MRSFSYVLLMVLSFVVFGALLEVVATTVQASIDRSAAIIDNSTSR